MLPKIFPGDLEVNMKHLGTVTLETERLILRRFTLDDAEDAFRNRTNIKKVTKNMILTSMKTRFSKRLVESHSYELCK